MKRLTCEQCGDEFTPDYEYACSDQFDNTFCSIECLMEYARESSRPLDDDDWKYAEEESDDEENS